MPSCGNSSNILSTQNNITLSTSGAGSRLECRIDSGDYASGITSGNVVFYNTSTSRYEKSQANDQVTAEVFGIVESYNASDSSLTVIINGSINLPDALLEISSAEGGSGGKDVYFLSAATAGKLQDISPTDVGNIVKPVYQVGPHGSYTGIVNNYIGYVVGGESEIQFDRMLGGGVGSFSLFMDGAEIPPEFSICNGETLVKYNENPKFIEKMDLTLPYIMKLQPLDATGLPITPNSNFIGSRIAADTKSSFSSRPERAQYQFPSATVWDVDNTYYYIKIDPATYSYNTSSSKPVSKINTSEHVLSSGYSMPPLGFNYNYFFFGSSNGLFGGNFYINAYPTLHGLLTPKVSFTNDILTSNNRKLQSFSADFSGGRVADAGPLRVYIKTKSSEYKSLVVPNELTINKLIVDGLTLGNYDLAQKISNIETNLTACLNRLRITAV
jgi:hypothetical protein